MKKPSYSTYPCDFLGPYMIPFDNHGFLLINMSSRAVVDKLPHASPKCPTMLTLGNFWLFWNILGISGQYGGEFVCWSICPFWTYFYVCTGPLIMEQYLKHELNDQLVSYMVQKNHPDKLNMIVFIILFYLNFYHFI